MEKNRLGLLTFLGEGASQNAHSLQKRHKQKHRGKEMQGRQVKKRKRNPSNQHLAKGITLVCIPAKPMLAMNPSRKSCTYIVAWTAHLQWNKRRQFRPKLNEPLSPQIQAFDFLKTQKFRPFLECCVLRHQKSCLVGKLWVGGY